MESLVRSAKSLKSRWLFLSVLLYSIASVPSVTAIGDASGGLAASLSVQELFIVFVLGLVYLYFFIFVLQRLFQREQSEKLGSAIVSGVGTLFAFLSIILGSIFMITSLLIVLAVAAQVTTFAWLVTVLQYYTDSVTIGVLAGGAVGGVLFLLGVYLTILLHGNPFSGSQATPTKHGEQVKIERDMDRTPVSLLTTVTYKVLDRDRDDPVPDVRVVFKQVNGKRFYTKFTDFSGEVTFRDIQGHGTEYYAYVDGDETRDKYRLIRKKRHSELGG